MESGPSRDHSKGTGSGYYVYSEASPPRKKGDKARLVSPVIKPTTDEECWVVFEAKINGITSDMALDDITFTPGCHLALLPNGTITKSTPMPCTAGLFHCRSSECILQSQVCDFIKQCKDGSDEDICGTCNFELVGNCGWNDRSTGRFKWQSHQGDSPGKFGPIKDHTSNSDIGKYMMVLGNAGVSRSHAILLTRPFGATASTCQVEFYVYMTGDGTGEISLNIINPVTRELMFEALPNVQHLMIGTSTDMAIDDVKLFNCRPKLPAVTSSKSLWGKPTTSVPSLTNKAITSTPSVMIKTSTRKGPKVCGNDSFLCPTAPHLCFPSAFLCDGYADCPDKYDEEHCTTCPKGQTYCVPKQKCISSHRCDNNIECPDGSDESACKGQCKDKNVNFRCLVVKSSAEKSKNKKVWVIPLGIIMALVITAVVFSGIYFFWIRKTKTFSPERVDGGITNPAYDYGTNLPTEFNMLDLEPAFKEPVVSLSLVSFSHPFSSLYLSRSSPIRSSHSFSSLSQMIPSLSHSLSLSLTHSSPTFSLTYSSSLFPHPISL
ncbi:unnamed protein product [Acanthosepion pharaonis]|uniref:MAM domain-containing protein n=1 Tax=Acanthosepion pharaonis TaxID=158019 RepID=A0A812BY90_ACAPH|nr:unnamed protein product [Sepia pharaonis]